MTTAQDAPEKAPVASVVVGLRLSPELHDAVSEAAKHRGMTTSAWLRQSAATCAMLEGVLAPPQRAA
jgi:predicted HicB family RNase H-like nuclease